MASPNESMNEQTIYLAGGCFWGVERYIGLIPGVVDTNVGYANGRSPTVTYEQVCQQNTGHAETVRVRFDADLLPLKKLLLLFFDAIDPTSVNRQGNDVGTQYRTGIYYSETAQLPEIQAAMRQLQTETHSPVAVEVCPLAGYCSAEEYHQDYLVKNPGGYCHIDVNTFIRLTAKLKLL